MRSVTRARPALRTLRALLPPVVLSIIAAVAGLAMVRFLVPPGTLHDSNGEVGNYLQTLGTVYAVLLAFVVFVVWNQFNDVRSLVEQEANELLDLYRTSTAFDAGVADPLRRSLRSYVVAVLGREWNVVACGENVNEEVTGILDELWLQLAAVEPRTECHRAVFDEMLQRFNDLSDARTRRLSASRNRIPLALNILIYGGAVVTVASMYLFEVRSFAVHALITGALAGAISHVLYVIADLDDPVGGDWQVPRTAFVRVQRYIERGRATAP